ncbi:MAG: AmmeMemoRadiSam system protein B [Candidatus Omnitrophica bacterium]|nr:AmmeMemoRadiSam system protein B [Candidatus Omnitrophota bacterium]
MRDKYIFLFIFCLTLINIKVWAQAIKEPNVSGSFYPREPKELSLMIDKFLSEVIPESLEDEVFGLILPHAGYLYSGKTASFGYRLIKGKSYRTVIIMGPSHYYGFTGVSIYPEGKFRTPLGDIEIDKEFTRKLLFKDKYIFFNPLAFEKEHSIEVHLPFLQKVLKDFKIVPVVMGKMDLEMSKRFIKILKESIDGYKDILVIASSDMYHGYDYELCRLVDTVTLTYLKNMDVNGLYEAIQEQKAQLCGAWPVLTLLMLAKDIGYYNLKILNYTNSSEVMGNRTKGIWTVGYASCVLGRYFPSSANEISHFQNKEVIMLNKEQKRILLEIARRSIEFYLKTGKKLEINQADPMLIEKCGAFVTLHKHGQLRGCIGNIIGDKPLYLTVRDMAIESAVGDPRFAPLDLEELKEVEIEISVLSPLKKVDDPQEIILGKHGVMVRKGFRSGVFLPQVATETDWSKEEFLSYLCSHKAGLSPYAWKDKDTELYIFSAEVFSEEKLE